MAIQRTSIILVRDMSQRILIALSFLFGSCSPAVEKMPWPVPIDHSQGGTLTAQPVKSSHGESRNNETRAYRSTNQNATEESWITPLDSISPQASNRPPLPSTGLWLLLESPASMDSPGSFEKRMGFHFGVDMSANTERWCKAQRLGMLFMLAGAEDRRVVIQHIAGYRTSYVICLK